MIGKERDILVIFILTIVTLGIYWLYWYYCVNAELRAHSERVDVAPGLAVICQFIPIVNFVSKYNTADRLLTVQRECDDPERISPLAAVLFAIFIPLGIYTYMVQKGINRHWEQHRRRLAAARPVDAQIIQ